MLLIFEPQLPVFANMIGQSFKFSKIVEINSKITSLKNEKIRNKWRHDTYRIIYGKKEKIIYKSICMYKKI